MRTKNKTAVALFCFLLAAFAVSDAKESSDPTISTAPSPYPVMDSGVWADWRFFSGEINWIDNQRILFKTIKDNDKTKIGIGPFNLSVWEIGKGIKPYTDYFPSVTACISGDMIHRTQKEANGSVQRFYGKFGEEKLFEFPKTKGAFFDDMNCRPNVNPEILAKRAARRYIKLLLERHGYLDLGSNEGEERFKNMPVTLYLRGDLKGVSLPIGRNDAEVIRYYSFKDAYFIHRMVTVTGNHSQTAWWLYPSGKAEKTSFTARSRPYVTRSGVITGWGAPKSRTDPGTSGLYLWSNIGIIKLISGHVNGLTVSPDGCAIAFAHYPYPDASLIKDPGRITLKMINVCTEEKKP